MTRTNTSIAVIGLGDDGTIIAVAHCEFAAMQTAQMQALGKANHVLYDL